MAATRKKPGVDLKTATSPVSAILRQFTEGDGELPGLTFFRMYYDCKIGREGLWPMVQKKLRPVDDLVQI